MFSIYQHIVKPAAKVVFPRRWRSGLRQLWTEDRTTGLRRIVYYGRSRYCPICKAHLHRFFPFRAGPDPLAVCPICFSHGRQRMYWLWLPRATDLFDGRTKRVLHVGPNGPEYMISRLLQRVPSLEYVGADLDSRRAPVRMDIRSIDYPDDFFDVILCSHVLEHVDEDRKAIAEFFRILDPGGWAILQVPITAENTVEDTSVSDPEERARRFGQFDHVRRYGKDYKDRLEEVGFVVEMLPGSQIFSREELAGSELLADEDRGIWFARKLR